MESIAKTNEESKGFYKLSWLQRIGFGSGDLAQNLIYQTVCMYLLIFYTNVYGLKPEVAAFMFLIVRVVDVLWDPRWVNTVLIWYWQVFPLQALPFFAFGTVSPALWFMLTLPM